jgi:hypothetical protein
MRRHDDAGASGIAQVVWASLRGEGRPVWFSFLRPPVLH